jgi:hypothetical protein
MVTETELADREAIKELRAKYCHYFDAQEVDNWVSLFAEGGGMDAGEHGTFTGEEELSLFINGAFAEDPYMAHRVDNPIVEIDGDSAEGHWYFEAIQREPSGEATIEQGKYHETYVKTDEGWKFEEIQIEFDASIEVADRDVMVELS